MKHWGNSVSKKGRNFLEIRFYRSLSQIIKDEKIVKISYDTDSKCAVIYEIESNGLKR